LDGAGEENFYGVFADGGAATEINERVRERFWPEGDEAGLDF